MLQTAAQGNGNCNCSYEAKLLGKLPRLFRAEDAHSLTGREQHCQPISSFDLLVAAILQSVSLAAEQ